MDVQELKIKEEPQDDIDLDFNAVPYMDIKVENELILDDGYLSCTEDFRDDSTQNTEATETFSSSCQSLDSQLNRETTSVQLKNYQCANCKFSSFSRLEFKKHLRKELYEKSLANVKLILKGHNGHHFGRNRGTGNFVCHDCKFRTKFKSSLKRHIMAHHTNERPYSCSFCSYRSLTSQNLNYHIISKHEPEKKQIPTLFFKTFSCEDCDFVTHKQHYLRRHTESQHRGGPKPFSCPLCPYSTVQSHHLKRHVLSRHSEERPFACTQCDYSTKRESLLRNHVLVKHQKRKPFPCPQPGCTYRSARTDYLKVHVMAKHSKQRRFNCPYCPYKSTFPQSLKIHVTKTHRDSEP